MTWAVLVLAGCNRAPEADWVLRNVFVIDVESGLVSDVSDLWIQGHLIHDITPAGVHQAPDIPQVDGDGGYALPGLWDMHAHVVGVDHQRRPIGESLRGYVAAGLVGVRDLGMSIDTLRVTLDSLATFAVPTPEVVLTGPILAQLDYGHPLFEVIEDSVDVLAVLRDLRARGARAVKVHDWIGPSLYRALAANSRSLGLPLIGHIPVTVPPGDVAASGQRVIEHLGGLTHDIARACSTHPTDDVTRELLDQVLRTGDVDIGYGVVMSAAFVTPIVSAFDPVRCRRLARSFARDSVWQVPNLVLYRHRIDIAEREEDKEALRDLYDLLESIVRIMNEEGVPLLAGVDEARGYDLHDELEALVGAGLAPIDAIRSATVNAAEFLGRADSAGTIAVGKVADVTVLAGNPLLDISQTRTRYALILRGSYVGLGDAQVATRVGR